MASEIIVNRGDFPEMHFVKTNQHQAVDAEVTEVGALVINDMYWIDGEGWLPTTRYVFAPGTWLHVEHKY